MKFVITFFLIVFFILFALFFIYGDEKSSLEPSTTEIADCFTTIYRLRNAPISSISTDWAINLNVNHFNENLSLICEFNYTTHEFRIVDLNKDEVIKTIKFPDVINKIGSIAIADTNNFAFITDTTFYIFNNGNLRRIEYGIFNDDYIPLNYINIIYNAKKNELIAGVLTYTNRKVDQVDYSSYFLNVYDLNTMTSSLIPFSYPKQFHGNKLGIPKVYLSQIDDDLLVSFELDDNVYKINLKTNNVDTISCKSAISNINEAFFPKQGNKQSKVDAIQKNNLNVGGYGLAFKNKNKIYRLYRPGLPIRDSNGNYFNSADKGTHILEMDLTTNSLREIQLANGQYYVPQHWSFNKFKGCLVYPKLEEHVSKKNLCFYNIHSISFYN